MSATDLPAQSQLKPTQKNRKGKRLYQYLATTVVGLSTLQCGMTLGWSSPMLPYLTSKESFIIITEDQTSWISSLLEFGAVLGAVAAGKVADRIGRRRSILGFTNLFLVSWLLLIFSIKLWCIYLARLLAGVACGAICVIAIIYIGEIAEVSIRGALGSVAGMPFTVGILLAYIAGSVLSYTGFAIAGALMAMIFIVMSPFLTESPVWLVQQNRIAEAGRPLHKLRGTKYDIDNEIALLQAEATDRHSRKGGIRDLVRTKAGRKALVISLGLTFFQQSSGIGVIAFYTVTLFQMAKSSTDPFMATVIIGAVGAVMELLTTLLIDKAGRRPLLILSGMGTALCLAIFAWHFKVMNSGNATNTYGWVPLASLIIATITFAIGFGNIPWIMNGELYPPETKAVAGSIAGVFNWGLQFVVVKLYPFASSKLGDSVVFWTFSILIFIGGIFAIFVVPETKGKTLQEIQVELSK